DRQVVVSNPDILGREKILKVHMRKVPLSPDVDARVIARGTPGFSGADLANLINEAALLAARKNRRVVSMQELEEAKDKVMMGSERRSLVMTEDEKKLTAYHEGGHALVMIHAKGHDPLHKVTIIPRGRALGLTMFLPERDKYSQSRTELEAMIASLFGGRIAEEMVFGAENVTTGASDDIRRATQLARSMVTEYGFSDILGPLRYSENQEEVFLGHSVTQTKNVSESTQRIIDEETKVFVERGGATARKILEDHLDDLHTIANALLEYETLSKDDIDMLLRGEDISQKDGGESDAPPSSGNKSSVPSSGPVGLGPEPQPGS
ncbi:MAG: cell division protein FtsH, partial [Alphaproteobacteria bacterium]|nr:cell division protein FtsH [Alphaproteobacteria bacterium]